MARRSIYSRRQAQAPGTYETPLADFLDALPQYVTQYQQNKLQLERQALQEKRYNDAQQIAKEQRDLERDRYNSALKRQEDKNTRDNYNKIIDGTPKFDYKTKKTIAETFGFDDEVNTYDELINTQGESMTELRSKISDIQNLPPESTFYQFDDLVSDIDPKSREMLKETDNRSYRILLSAEKKFDQQRSTNMRAMPTQIKTELASANSQKSYIEREMIKVAQKMPSIDTDNKTAQEILKALRATGVDPTGELRSLKSQLAIFENTINDINNDYSIKRPVNELPGKKVPPSITENGVVYPLAPSYSFDNYYNSEELLANTAPDSPSEAEQSLELQEARLIMATEPEDSPEYKSAMDSLNILESKPLPGLGGLIERLSVAGKERAETGEGIRGIRPESRVFDLPPVEDPTDLKYVDRVLSQFDRKLSQLKTLALRPEQYRGSGASDKVNQINSNLKAKDNLISQIKELYKKMPKTKKFEKQLKSIKSIIQDNPTGLEAFLDSKARKGKGEFKFKKGKVSEEDKVLLAELNSILNFELEQGKQEPISTVENLIRSIAPIRADTPSGFRIPQN